MKNNFATSLAIGKQGEYWLMGVLPGLVRLDGRKADFTLAGERLELKTDSYDMHKTPNLFIEQYSDTARLSPGGPWQAKQNGCTIWVYTFRANRMALVFDLELLLAYIENNLGNFGKRSVVNQGWITTGLLVPRDQVMHTCILTVHQDGPKGGR
jgi:hypothetical protein